MAHTIIEHQLQSTALENSILDRNNPGSLINMVPATLGEAIQRVPESLLGLAEQELKEELAELGQVPNLAVHRLRVSFWNEYSNAQVDKRKMVMHRIYHEVCNDKTWFNLLKFKPGHLAWILCPLPAYAVRAEEALLQGIDQLRDILMQSHLDFKGQLDAKKAAVKVEIVKFLDQRVKGAIIQKTQNLHAHLKAPEKPSEQPKTLEEVEKRMRELERQALALSTPGLEQSALAESDDAIVAEFVPVPQK